MTGIPSIQSQAGHMKQVTTTDAERGGGGGNRVWTNHCECVCTVKLCVCCRVVYKGVLIFHCVYTIKLCVV